MNPSHSSSASTLKRPRPGSINTDRTDRAAKQLVQYDLSSEEDEDDSAHSSSDELETGLAPKASFRQRVFIATDDIQTVAVTNTVNTSLPGKNLSFDTAFDQQLTSYRATDLAINEEKDVLEDDGVDSIMQSGDDAREPNDNIHVDSLTGSEDEDTVNEDINEMHHLTRLQRLRQRIAMIQPSTRHSHLPTSQAVGHSDQSPNNPASSPNESDESDESDDEVNWRHKMKSRVTK